MTETPECACYCGKFGPTGDFPFVRAGVPDSAVAVGRSDA